MRKILKRIGIAVSLSGLCLVSVMGWRLSRFKSRQIDVEIADPISLDLGSAVERFSAAIAIPTVSHQNSAKMESAKFDQFQRFLVTAYPRFHNKLSLMTGNTFGDDRNQSLLFRWKGESDDQKAAILLMAHYDVVPVETSSLDAWSHLPFSGDVDDEFIWGRGTLDDKCGVIGLMEAVEYLIEDGFTPDRTLYLSFGHDEEVGGTHGNQPIAEWMRSQGIQLEFVLDEGGGIFKDVPGLNQPAALVGIAEKGFLTVKLTVELEDTGHSSIPPQETTIGMLAETIGRLQKHPFPTRLDGGAGLMLDFVGPEMPMLQRIAVSNQWLLGSLIKNQLSATAVGNAAVRTTIAPTIIEGGFKDNVLPTKASVTLNLRILPGETIDSTLKYLRKIVDEDRVRISDPILGKEPSRMSSIESNAFAVLHRTIREIYPEVVVAPFVVVAGTDAAHYDDSTLSRNVYRFTPWKLGQNEIKRIHGIDERMPRSDFGQMIRFYERLIRNATR